MSDLLLQLNIFCKVWSQGPPGKPLRRAGLIFTLRYTYAKDVKELALFLNSRLSLGLDLDKVIFIRSQGSRSRALARTLGLPSQWRFILGDSRLYIVEVISEKYDRLSCEEKVYVILHELMHIPTSMSGGLRHHGYRGFGSLRRLMRMLDEKEIEAYCK